MLKETIERKPKRENHPLGAACAVVLVGSVMGLTAYFGIQAFAQGCVHFQQEMQDRSLGRIPR
ncbi:MAG: hypothetical protein GC136_03645 [Alphaproteobacteria bacterium]|nr:hypothetical protein [Alphaproteobacteria bacterium]